MTTNYNLRTCLLLVFCILSGVGMAQTYTFTSAGVTGRTGPTQGQVNTAYTATNLDGLVTINTQGIQEWVVPATGNYSIEAFGASGGTHATFSGHGAQISGEISLTMGTTLYILVGQMGSQNSPVNVDGGGGGTFITDGTNLLVAAGGGGGSAEGAHANQDASLSTAVSSSAAGQFGSTGAGYTVDGIHFYYGTYTTVAQSFLNGGVGQAGGEAGGWPGIGYGDGGFGGGGSACSCSTGSGGGGGGYNGGGGGNGTIGQTYLTGFGGSSYTIGSASNVMSSVIPGTGDGMVVITTLCSPSVGTLIADVASLSDVTEDCISTPIAPTASNNCGSMPGTPDVSFPITTVGTTTVTWTYDDGTNIVTQTQDVIITGTDVTPPVVDNANLSDLAGQCDFTPPTPTATDLCSGALSGVADVTFPLFTQGLTVITWTYTDGNGNTETQTQNVTLNDVAPPSLDVPTLSDYIGCGSATPPAPTATDYCSGGLNGTPDVTFPITTAGPTTVTWTFVDDNGNTVSQTQDVYVTEMDLAVTLNVATISANATGVTYQWMDCNSGQIITGETGQTYTAMTTGDYAVIITNGNCVDTSACTLVDFTGVDELNTNPITVYPNPTSGSFMVEFDGNINQIIVSDALGRVLELPVNLTTGEIDGSSLASGNYTVSVITANTIYRRDIVVLK